MDVQGGRLGVAFWSETWWYSNWAVCVHRVSKVGTILKFDCGFCIGLPGLYEHNVAGIQFHFLVNRRTVMSLIS
jgi:hypothetical protein